MEEEAADKAHKGPENKTRFRGDDDRAVAAQVNVSATMNADLKFTVDSVSNPGLDILDRTGF